MRKVSVGERRRAVVRQHHLAGDGGSPEAVTRALLALHATDPASVYLSVLVRSREATLEDIAEAMYERRTLVRWMAMRRTLFVFHVDDVPMIQAAVSTPLAAMLRRQLVSRLERNGTEPPVEGDVGAWLADTENRVEQALRTRESAAGAQLSADVRELRTAITPRAPSDLPMNVTSPLLTLMSAEGRMVRGIATGAWTTRHHRWEPLEHWWPEGLPELPIEQAQRELAEKWLTVFGPATVDDVQWWTGWNKTTTRKVLAELPIEEVDLHGEPGIALGDPDESEQEHHVATLLPALDPTPMGWKRREWLFGIPPEQVMDRTGNIGPTLWLDGEIVGAWAVTASGEIRTKLVTDRGSEATNAIEKAVNELHKRLQGATITPVFRTPLERELAAG